MPAPRVRYGDPCCGNRRGLLIYPPNPPSGNSPPATLAPHAGLDDIQLSAHYDSYFEYLQAALGFITTIGDEMQQDTALSGFIIPSEYQSNDCDNKNVVQEAAT